MRLVESTGVPIVLAHSHQQRVACDSSVVDEDVNPAEIFDCLLDQQTSSVSCRDIGGGNKNSSTKLFKFGFRFFRRFSIAAIANDQIVAVVRQSFGNGKSNAACTAGDDGNLLGFGSVVVYRFRHDFPPSGRRSQCATSLQPIGPTGRVAANPFGAPAHHAGCPSETAAERDKDEIVAFFKFPAASLRTARSESLQQRCCRSDRG